MSPPVAPPTLHSLTRPKGFSVAAWTCGLKPSGKPDLALIAADSPCPAAGVFTRNKVKGEPVKVGIRHLRSTGGMLRAVVVNSGCSNVATGEQGRRAAVATCEAVAAGLGCASKEVVPCSTGVIGRHLDMSKLLPGIESALPRLSRGERADSEAARAILTTDLVPKAATRTVTLGTKRITLGGICKGSGMIAPNLATMLAFVTTDAKIAPDLLKAMLRQATAASFNRVTVDTDTSTSDSVVMLASGAAGNTKISKAGKHYAALLDALTGLCQDLAYQLVCDGEGATKVFRVSVAGARSERDADKVGRSVAESPLVKTAVHGGDPNWGRLAMAVGKSGAAVKPEAMTLAVGGVCVYEGGMPTKLNATQQKQLAKAMAGREVRFSIGLGLGDACCEWLGCDLSREYIRINAEYTT
ncbi:MAG: bifunctional glutamate N-acetyltransferase/amino-acid acetyltransferase ArgJ [Phycisphaerales bacterium JB063]